LNLGGAATAEKAARKGEPTAGGQIGDARGLPSQVRDRGEREEPSALGVRSSGRIGWEGIAQVEKPVLVGLGR